MLILELLYLELSSLNDAFTYQTPHTKELAYTTLSQNVIGSSMLSQAYCKMIG